ncbi:MAG: hypothetical protein IPP35_10165 [Elusimicrobia bacterium]|nr:hypothetical protein [Elusimicrobiota bacterium]
MRKEIRLAGLLVLGALLGAAPVPPKKAAEEPLSPGRYSATIKAFVCGGCAEWVESHLQSQKSLENVKAVQETKALSFTVKKGAKVKRSDVQKVLDAAAKEMGMGADYEMTALRKM